MKSDECECALLKPYKSAKLVPDSKPNPVKVVLAKLNVAWKVKLLYTSLPIYTNWRDSDCVKVISKSVTHHSHLNNVTVNLKIFRDTCVVHLICILVR